MSEQAQRLLDAIRKNYTADGDWFTASGVGGISGIWVDKEVWSELKQLGYIRSVDVDIYQYTGKEQAQ